MRYLIASDFHLSELNRLDDFISSLYEIQLVADRIKPDKYIIAGDIFDSRKPSPLELKIFSNHLKMVDCDKEIIPGNHDRLDKTLTTLDWYDSNLADPREIIDGKYKILITHCGVKEMKIGAAGLNFKTNLSYKDFSDYDVVIFGHIHKPQILNKKNPLAFCPGSIDKVTFGERDDDKYVWILDINEDIKLGRHKLKTRNMVYIKLNLDTKTKEINIKDFKLEESIIKLDIFGSKDKIKALNYDKIMNKFKGAYKLSVNFAFTDSKGVNTKSVDNNSINEFFKDYAIKKNLDVNVTKLCGKILENEFKTT